ncbi:MAG: ABC transporter permease, partial [Acidobacteriota bacterium]
MRADRPTLPRSSAWLLRRALPAAYRAEMLADIEEAFVRDVRAVGLWRARWRLRIELVAILVMHRRHLAVGHATSSSLPERSPQRKMPMDSLAQDARFALRRLRAQSGATGLVVALLALGIGATATLYTVLDAVFLQPVPYPAADRLAAIGTTFGPQHDRLASMSWPNYDDLAASTRSFDALGAALPLSLVATGADGAVKMAAAAASPQLLDMLGATPALGRMPSAAEWRGDESAVALISHGAWLRLFGGPTDLAGLRIDTTDGASYPVVGVLPRDFVAPEAAGVGNTDVWLPAALVLDQLDDRGARVLGVIGRLTDGVGLPAAQA